MATDSKKDISWRVMLMYFVMLIAGLTIIGRAAYIQFAEGDKYREMVIEETIKAIDIDPVRGSIYACDGRVLVTSVPIFDVRIDAANEQIPDEDFYSQVDSLAYCLSDLFKDRTQNDYRSSIINARKAGNRYFLLKRNVEYSQLKAMRSFPIFRLGKYKGGLIAIQKDRREMPFRILAARTIGFSRPGFQVGIEGYYNAELQGVAGKKIMQRIARNVWIPINDESLIEPQHGKDIITTINVDFQDVAEMSLMRNLEKHRADHGCAILMEVKTGHIKAIANLKRDTASGSYKELYNFAVGEASEPGSTFKLISMMAALDDKLININDTVNTGNGVVMFFGSKMSDSHEGGYGKISVKKAFEVSSNVGISKIIYNAYARNPQKYIDKLKHLRLHQSLGLDILGEGIPKVKDPKDKNNWYGTTLPWMSIGYEIALTPLQILTVYNAVANNGRMVKPMFVQEIRQAGEVVRAFPTEVMVESVCSDETTRMLRSMLEGVVEYGTARNIKNSVYKIAGKTGTAQIAIAGAGYNKTNYKASFAGYFPADNPQYSCIVVINNPSSGMYYGASVAAPVFKEIADKVYAVHHNIEQKPHEDTIDIPAPVVYSGHRDELVRVYRELNYETVSDNIPSIWVKEKTDGKSVELFNHPVKPGVVPDVLGMVAKDAVYLLESQGLKVVLVGKGWVQSQSIAPGVVFQKGTTISLNLNI